MTVMMSLASRLRAARLFLRTGAGAADGDLDAVLRAAYAGGVDVVEIAEPGLSHEDELAALEVARAAGTGSQGLVCVHGSARLAATFAGDLLLLGPDDGSARRARRRLHPWAIVGRSAGSAAEVDAALADPDVGFLCVGGDEGPADVDLVRHVAEAAPVADVASKPWFVGPVGADLDAVLAAGARRVVVDRTVLGDADPRAAARTLKDRLRQAWAGDPALASYALRSAALDA